MEDFSSTLWALEQDFWLDGGDMYRRHLADEALMVFPGMTLTKPQTIDSLLTVPRWTSVSSPSG